MDFSPLIAEVGDKEPSLVALWCIAVALSALGFLVSRRRRAFCVLLGPFAAIWACAVYQALRDPYVGLAMLQELGRSYVIQGYVALVLPFVAGSVRQSTIGRNLFNRLGAEHRSGDHPMTVRPVHAGAILRKEMIFWP